MKVRTKVFPATVSLENRNLKFLKQNLSIFTLQQCKSDKIANEEGKNGIIGSHHASKSTQNMNMKMNINVETSFVWPFIMPSPQQWFT